MFGGVVGFDSHLRWWNPEHRKGPDGNYRRCVDPLTIGLTLKGGVYVTKYRGGKAKTDEISLGPVLPYRGRGEV